MHCTNCGQKLSDRNGFCPKCGTPRKTKGPSGSAGPSSGGSKNRTWGSVSIPLLLVCCVLGAALGWGVFLLVKSDPFSSSGNPQELKADLKTGISIYSDMINESAGWAPKCLSRAKERREREVAKWRGLSRGQRELNPTLQPQAITPFLEWGGCWWESVQPEGYKKALVGQNLIGRAAFQVEEDDTRFIPKRSAFEDGPLQPAECGEAAYRLYFQMEPDTAGLTPIEDLDNPGYGPGGFDQEYLGTFVNRATQTQNLCDLGKIPALREAERTLMAAGPGGFEDYWPDQPSSEPWTDGNSQTILSTNGEFPERCSDELLANDVTSCEFARSVLQEFRLLEPEFDPAFLDGSGVSVTAASPITGDTYEMNCRNSAGGTIVCREVNASDGANDAAILFLGE